MQFPEFRVEKFSFHLLVTVFLLVVIIYVFYKPLSVSVFLLVLLHKLRRFRRVIFVFI